MVWDSKIPGVFNLGGDLRLFSRLIREGDQAGLLAYATACVDVVYNNIVGLGLPILTISLVEGDALGGGFEKALSTNVLIAERGTRFGLPEVLFGLFPGMGAYSLISRRIGSAQAKRMVLSGRVYCAEELYELGLVDVLSEPGEGRQTVDDFIARNTRHHAAQCAVFRADQRVNPLAYEELYDIALIWVEAVKRKGVPRRRNDPPSRTLGSKCALPLTRWGPRRLQHGVPGSIVVPSREVTTATPRLRLR
jgi:DSF synthase